MKRIKSVILHLICRLRGHVVEEVVATSAGVVNVTAEGITTVQYCRRCGRLIAFGSIGFATGVKHESSIEAEAETESESANV